LTDPVQTTQRIRDHGYATLGIVGTGAISEIYVEAAAASPLLRLKSCAARSVASATPTAERYGATAVSLEELLADPEIDLVLNLTGMPAHHAINTAALEAGKHVYSEKPLATTYAEARDLLALAARQELRVGCAPDTLLGGGHQAGRAVLDSGRIGAPVAAAAFLGLRGVENFVGDPAGYFAHGGPLFDVGPYYVSQLVTLLGPVTSVVAGGIIGAPTRTVETGPRQGLVVDVLIPTTVSAVLRFASGAQATLTLSIDAWQHSHPALEIYGSEGTLSLPDPNFFGGEPRVSVRKGPWEAVPVADRPLSTINFELPFGSFANYRGAGVDELVDAIVADRPHRTSAELATHVLEVLEAVATSIETSGRVAVESTCDRPAPVGDGSWTRRTEVVA
jgi:predicted dehydrogenase